MADFSEFLSNHLANMLSWQQWTLLAAIPPLIVLLYFLKLKRRPVEVPSTYLWHKSIEDLHVNSIWQRLRRNLLMLLQLLLILLAAAALLRPSFQGRKLTANRLIFLIDNSASMQATDVEPSRLANAKLRAGELIDEMQSGDVAMIISFADSARVEQPFTDDRRLLRQRLDAIQPTERSTALLEALKVASGLANPGRSATDISDVQVAEALPADLYIFSDGCFEPVSGFSLGNLKPTFVSIGRPAASNVAISAFSVGRGEVRQDQLQAFGRLENFGDQERKVDVELLLDDKLIDADHLLIPVGESRGVAFDLGTIDSGILRLYAIAQDDLAIDDQAYAVVSQPRKANVLVVSPGNEPLELVLQTKLAAELATVEFQTPEFLKTPKYRTQANSEALDLIIFDRCKPERMPQSNTLWIAAVPPGDGWAAKDRTNVPRIIDVQRSHPLMQWLDLGDVLIAEGTPLGPPSGGTVLIDTDAGPMVAVAPRETFEDAVIGFPIVGLSDHQGSQQNEYATNWPLRPSFPAFVLNVLEYLGRGRRGNRLEGLRPGTPVPLDTPSGQSTVIVRSPTGENLDVAAPPSGKAVFSGAQKQGVYQVLAGGKPFDRFAVNLFDARESRIRPEPKPSLKVGYVEVQGQTAWTPARRELWKWLLACGLGVLLLEWYIYNRRIYI